MTWLVPRLNHRAQIGKGILIASGVGGFNFTFNSFITIWIGIRPLSYYENIRGEQVGHYETHEVTLRISSIASLGIAFTIGFDNGFDSIADLSPLKSDYFIFLQKGSTVKGQLFRIRRLVDNNEQGEYLRILVEQLEERASGFPA